MLGVGACAVMGSEGRLDACLDFTSRTSAAWTRESLVPSGTQFPFLYKAQVAGW